MAAVSAAQVVSAILAGRCDGKITDIMQAVKSRVEAGEIGICWKVAFDDLEITEENQTINEVLLVNKQTGKDWGGFHPSHSGDCAAIVVAALVERKGMKASEAFDLIKSRPAVEFVRAVSEYEVASPPKDATSTSA